VALADINLIGTDGWADLLTLAPLGAPDSALVLRPYQTVWLSNRDGYTSI
jgi:sucrose phosphorylase